MNDKMEVFSENSNIGPKEVANDVNDDDVDAIFPVEVRQIVPSANDPEQLENDSVPIAKDVANRVRVVSGDHYMDDRIDRVVTSAILMVE